MTEPTNKTPPFPEKAFDEAIARPLQTNSEEIADARQRVQKRQEEVAREADKIDAEIKRGIRPAGKKFRL